MFNLQCGSNSQQNASQMLTEVWRCIEIINNNAQILNIFSFCFSWSVHHILKQLMTNYRVLKDKGVYILVAVPLHTCIFILFFPLPTSIFFKHLLTCLFNDKLFIGHLWSTDISSELVEKFQLVEDKASCHR